MRFVQDLVPEPSPVLGKGPVHLLDGEWFRHEVALAVFTSKVLEQFQLGLGSALSVLLFLSVLLLAFLIVKLFRVDLASARGEG